MSKCKHICVHYRQHKQTVMLTLKFELLQGIETKSITVSNFSSNFSYSFSIGVSSFDQWCVLCWVS